MGQLILQGTGKVTACPDTAHLTATIDTVHKTTGPAITENNEKMAVLIALLESSAILKKHIQTIGFNIFQKRRHKDKEVYDWCVSNQIRVTVVDITQLGDLLSLIGGKASVAGLHFQNSEIEKLSDEARALALEHAMHKADIYCKAGGFAIKEVSQIKEVQPYDVYSNACYGQMEAMSAAPGGGSPVEAGEQVTSITIEAIFEIEKAPQQVDEEKEREGEAAT